MYPEILFAFQLYSILARFLTLLILIGLLSSFLSLTSSAYILQVQKVTVARDYTQAHLTQ